MKRYLGISLVSFCSLLLVAGVVFGKPQQHEFSPVETYVDVVGSLDDPALKGAAGVRPANTSNDTCWIADWTFEGACAATQPGWNSVDLRITNLGGTHYWKVNGNYDPTAYAVGAAASITKHDLCWVNSDGYGNDWYMGICFNYTGSPMLSFTYAVDSEDDFDFLFVETDSACASFARVNYVAAPQNASAAYRDIVWADDGFDVATVTAGPVALTAYGAGSHCAYITFFADGGVSNEDDFPSTIGAGAVVDDILVSGGGISEDFTVVDSVTFRNMGDGIPFLQGTWIRTFSHVTDNDVCAEDIGCAWLATDNLGPTLAVTPGQLYGPGGFVVRSWLDEAVLGPWVDLASTAGSAGTVLSFRRFPGNFFNQGKILQNWAVRGFSKIANSDTPAGLDSLDCVSPWGHAFQWNSLSSFSWVTSLFNTEAHFGSASRKLQFRFRHGDWQWIAGSAPPTPSYDPGVGPVWDRVMVGRRTIIGPVMDQGIDARYQAQDAFPATQTKHLPNTYAQVPAGTDDIFKTVPWSYGTDLGINKSSPNLLVGDTITCNVVDVNGNDVVAPVKVYACIVSGPHAGKAPPPFTVGANGFFAVTADSAKLASGAVVTNRWFANIDDQYLLGGDALVYFWYATDTALQAASLPIGLNQTDNPTTITLAEAERKTGGLFQVNALPTVTWDADLLSAIAASGTGGKIDPYDAAHPEWRDDALNNGQPGRQKNCLLYYHNVNTRRRSSDRNRTSFMYTLDEVGYRGSYDVYDLTGQGNTNNQLGSRCSTAQARNYSLLVYDCGNSPVGVPILPNGVDLDANKINMTTWFQTWLDASGPLTSVTHSLWVIGTNAVEERRTGTGSSLVTAYLGVTWGSNVTINVNPDVIGTANYSFISGPKTFIGDLWTVNGGCPTVRNYDDLVANGATVTHSYGNNGVSSGEGAVAMNKNVTNDWNTIMQSHPWFDIRPADGSSAEPENALMQDVLQGTLPNACQEAIDPVDTGDDQDALPRAYSLAQNVPNPFNPVTSVKFELPRAGRTSLKIYDVAGRLVRTLVDESLAAGRHSKTWDGFDATGNRVSTGVYFYRLVSGDFSATNKMVMMK